MIFYLDTSVLLSMFLQDVHSPRIDKWVSSNGPNLAVSTWAESEFASVIRRKTRTLELEVSQLLAIQHDFDGWISQAVQRVDTTPEAGVRAVGLCKSAGLFLTAPDALHLAISMLAGMSLVTFDAQLAAAATATLHPVVIP